MEFDQEFYDDVSKLAIDFAIKDTMTIYKILRGKVDEKEIKESELLKLTEIAVNRKSKVESNITDEMYMDEED